MNLPRDGREYVHWPITNAPTGAVFEAYVNGVWVAAASDSSTVTLLLEGPDLDPTLHDPSAVVLTTSQMIKFRVTNISPEVVVRGGGWIILE
jgi:hypothetical protein